MRSCVIKSGKNLTVLIQSKEAQANLMISSSYSETHQPDALKTIDSYDLLKQSIDYQIITIIIRRNKLKLLKRMPISYRTEAYRISITSSRDSADCNGAVALTCTLLCY